MSFISSFHIRNTNTIGAWIMCVFQYTLTIQYIHNICNQPNWSLLALKFKSIESIDFIFDFALKLISLFKSTLEKRRERERGKGKGDVPTLAKHLFSTQFTYTWVNMYCWVTILLANYPFGTRFKVKLSNSEQEKNKWKKTQAVKTRDDFKLKWIEI